MKRMAILIMVMVLGSATVVTALAGGPVISTYEEDTSYPFINCGYLGIGNFRIWNHEVWSSLDKFWYDENNLVYRATFHMDGDSHIYADFDPENVITFHWIMNADNRYDPPVPDPYNPYVEPSQSHVSEMGWNVHLPGSGNVLHVTGTRFYENGQEVMRVGLQIWDRITLCEYFNQFAP